MCKNITSEVMRRKSCKRQLSDLKYPPCGFNEHSNNTNSDNRNSNYNDNNDNDNNNDNTDNKHKNIKNDNINFCNRQ